MTQSPATAAGSDWIAEFLHRVGSDRVFTLTGGACAFMIDAVARHPALHYDCFQHEQSAAMAADAVWRVTGKVGVTMATSGPGATNLITGIATSFFDSIPTLHITGQVNQREGSAYHGAKVRQSGFQETDIVAMVAPITKYAVKITSIEELQRELPKAYALAMSGRRGPVLVDVPMDIQQAEVEMVFAELPTFAQPVADDAAVERLASALRTAKRPVVLWGGGVGFAGVEQATAAWLAKTGLPFVSSWAGLTYFDHDHPGFLGQIGVYGNRGANFALQNADTVIVLGSRLDNRQRSGNAANWATGAKVIVVDVDGEELKKYQQNGYETVHMDLAALPPVLDRLPQPTVAPEWSAYTAEMRARYFGQERSSSAVKLNSLSPYDVVRRLNAAMDEDAIVPNDTGAAVCWVHQAFKVKRHLLFTSGGNSPMGYSLPAAIGAKLVCPDRQVVAFNGDGGIQLNLQDLQTIVARKLDIALVIMNNRSYGIIKQFQDSYLGSRYDASYEGYSTPDFGRIAGAYGLDYEKVEALDQITPALFGRGPIIIDVMLSEHTLIEPKLEMGRPINDQFPYLSAQDYAAGNRFVAYPRPDTIADLAADQVSADDQEAA
ncbi:thiamine pyrophosphate-binding protein [Sphingomonas sp. TREG-RG-20F-R18-01]|uniref:thiamine pyrophosphate-binding protein n=1 Tax=Sphingomonas sp. TREG-RG-20F-R18-01 TaxID=2914982 RepID=UPI001F56066A|nr:thiamine pyrophosphate-binding protein [Sphingomonas sp. TREG-RG-20F-R18-01]